MSRAKKLSDDKPEKQVDSSAGRKASLAERPYPSPKIEIPVKPANPPPQKSSPENEAETKEEKAKRRERRFHEAMTWITGGLFLVGIATAVIMFKSIQQVNESIRVALGANSEAKTANDLTKRTFLLTQRPWVSAEIKAASELKIGPGSQVGMYISVTMHNHGQVPALYVNPVAGMYPSDLKRDAQSEQRAACGHLRKLPPAEIQIFETIFPGQTLTKIVHVGIKSEDVEAVRGEATKGQPFLVPILTGCADYFSPYEQMHRQTGFMFILMDDQARVIAPENGSIPPSRVVFQPIGQVVD